MQFLKRLLRARLQKAPTRNQWFADIGNLERLREILTDEVFVAAVNHILDERRISETEVFAHPDLLPLRAAYSSGHTSFIRDLESLAKAPIERSALPAEWSFIDEVNE